MKLIVLNRKLKEGEQVKLLSDSTPDNWRGEDGDAIVEKVWSCSIVNKVKERPKVCC